MKTFRLTAQVTISIYTEVEAETLKEAIELSGDRSIEPYDYGNDVQCEESWIAEEYDGEQSKIQEVE